MSLDKAKENISYCKKQPELAEYVGAICCVNIAGTNGGGIWDGGYKENFYASAYNSIIDITREIIDAVKPVKTKYSLEPTPYMVPYSPENYLKLLNDVNRSGFGVHLDAVNMINSPEKYFFNADFTN